jgi:hypothetical protein
MSCNDYTIELITTQLVTLENNTETTTHRAKNTQPLGPCLDCQKCQKLPSTPVVQLSATMSINYNKNTIIILIIF